MEARQKSKKLFIHKYKKEFKAYMLIGLPLFWWSIFFLFALGNAIYFSFTNFTQFIEKISKIHAENYLRIFSFKRLFSDDPMVRMSFDSQFWKSLGISGIWTFFTMIGSNFLGLLMSFLINKIKRGKNFFLAFLFWPSLVSAVVSASLSVQIFSADPNALFNKIVQFFGGVPKDWFNDPKLALPLLMVIPVLLGFSTKMIIYYAAVLSVPSSLYEAAKLDTGSDFKVFWHITLPLIRNAIMLNVTLSLIEGLKVLGPMQLATRGGPEHKTESIMLLIYNNAFLNYQRGRASAQALVLFVIILILTVIQQRVFRDKEAGSVN